MKILKATYEIPFICLTMGRNGSCAYYHDEEGTDECICTGKDSRYNRGLEIPLWGVY